MLRFFKKINSEIKGIIFICLASLFFSLMSTFVKLCSSNLTLIEIIFIRSLIASIILLPLIFTFKIKIKTSLYSKHLLRSIIGVSAMFLNFYAVSKLPLANYTIISFAKIFFIIPLAFLFLKEKIKTISFFYISLGFMGIIIMLGYEEGEKELFPYYACAILATLLIACIKIFIKNISKKENNAKIQFYFSLNSTLLLIIPYMFTFSIPLLKDFFFIFLLSIFGLLAQYFTIEGLKNSEAVKVMPFDYSRIIFGCIIGLSFFNEKISLGMVFGSLIIIFAGIKLIRIKTYNLNQ
ncbi:MAG: DMT family transporter [Alphaproteobacteria bacterium TMED93]|nr:MAG: DMT family transporter [Alphaproteobacteria bacterium TMED93]